jgi:hypothetical protein
VKESSEGDSGRKSLENAREDGDEGDDGVEEKEMLSSEAIIAAGVTVSARERGAKRPWTLGWYFRDRMG